MTIWLQSGGGTQSMLREEQISHQKLDKQYQNPQALNCKGSPSNLRHLANKLESRPHVLSTSLTGDGSICIYQDEGLKDLDHKAHASGSGY